jgi:hypothetical protein
VLQLGAEEARVRVEGLVEVLDGHAKMMDSPRVHAMMLTQGHSTAVPVQEVE